MLRAGRKTEVCPYHRLVNLDQAGKFPGDSECESCHARIEPWFVLSPVQEWYYARTHSDYKITTLSRADCQRGQDDVMDLPAAGIAGVYTKDLEWYVVLYLKWLSGAFHVRCTGISTITQFLLPVIITS